MFQQVLAHTSTKTKLQQPFHELGLSPAPSTEPVEMDFLEYPLTIRDGHHSDSSHDPTHKSPRTSLQSRVDSMWEDDRNFVLEFPVIHLSRKERSMSYLMESNLTRGFDSESAMQDDTESIAYLTQPPLHDCRTYPTPVQKSSPATTISHEILFIGVIIMAQFLALAGLAQSLASTSSITEDFHVLTSAGQMWFTTAYTLTIGAFGFIAVQIGDAIGYKRMLVLGYFFSGCWSAFAGFSTYVGGQIFFDVCRALQGVGVALSMTSALALLGRAYEPGKRRTVVFSFFGAMAPSGFVVGALFSSLFAQLAWWPWTFWSFAIAAWVLSAAAVIVVPSSLGGDARSAIDRRKQATDWKGSTLCMAGLVLINVAWNNGPHIGWAQPCVYSPFVVGILCMAGFIWVEIYGISPRIPIKALTKTSICTLAIFGLSWGSFGVWITYTWRFLLEVRDSTPLSASVQFTPLVILSLLGVCVNELLLARIPATIALLVSTLCFLAASSLGATQPLQQIYWAQTFASVIFVPFGIAISLSSVTALLSRNSHKDHNLHQSTTDLPTTFLPTLLWTSISLALALASTIESQVPRDNDSFPAIRGAYFVSIGLSSLSALLAAILSLTTLLRDCWSTEPSTSH